MTTDKGQADPLLQLRLYMHIQVCRLKKGPAILPTLSAI